MLGASIEEDFRWKDIFPDSLQKFLELWILLAIKQMKSFKWNILFAGLIYHIILRKTSAFFITARRVRTARRKHFHWHLSLFYKLTCQSNKRCRAWTFRDPKEFPVERCSNSSRAITCNSQSEGTWLIAAFVGRGWVLQDQSSHPNGRAVLQRSTSSYAIRNTRPRNIGHSNNSSGLFLCQTQQHLCFKYRNIFKVYKPALVSAWRSLGIDSVSGRGITT